jgi:hypothetical protein
LQFLGEVYVPAVLLLPFVHLQDLAFGSPLAAGEGERREGTLFHALQFFHRFGHCCFLLPTCIPLFTLSVFQQIILVFMTNDGMGGSFELQAALAFVALAF